jgi:hypothetical protein
MNKGKIFISYSHKDEEWKNRLVTQLEVLELEGFFDLWEDRRIETGTDWLPEIEKALNEAEVAILMVSANFLTSKFIRGTEVPRILERREKEGLKVIPVIVKPCPWKQVKWLSKMQVFPRDGVEIMKGSEYEIEKNLSNLAEMTMGNQLIAVEALSQTISNIIKDKKAVLLTALPQREIEIIGREEELKMLDERLKETKRLLLLNGLGGIGKTEVCKRFFLDNYQRFSFAGWFDYVSSIKESLVSGIKTDKVELNEKDTIDERFAKIMAYLNTLDEDTLLVIDNIEDPGDEHLGTIKKLAFKVIVNSRLHLEGFEVHTLDFLSEQSCKELFYNYYEGEKDDDYVEKVIELCGKHTLTVELLARTANEAGVPIKRLYEALEKEGFNLNDVIGENVHTFWHNEKDRKLFFDHLLKIFALGNVTAAELAVLVNLAVLPAVDISMENIGDWLGLKSKEEINSLVRKGWIRKRGFMIFMHQVIQEVIRYKERPDAKKCGSLITSLATNLYLEPGDNPIDKKEYVIYADVLARHIAENDEELARLANNLSLRYQDLGQLEKALEFQEKALNIREAVLAKNHPDLATSYHNLSTIYNALKDYKKAAQYAQQAVAILHHLFPNGHPNLDIMKENLEFIKKKMN